MRTLLALAATMFALAACGVQGPAIGPDGQPLPQIYRISAGDRDDVQFRLLDGVNALRASAGVGQVALNSELIAAAATHARDMSVQNRPWHFGSDGSSPLDRVNRVGYRGSLVGETISETFETELETLAAWMEMPDTRRVILDARARDIGIAWHQEQSGKLWWVLVFGAPRGGAGA